MSKSLEEGFYKKFNVQKINRTLAIKKFLQPCNPTNPDSDNICLEQDVKDGDDTISTTSLIRYDTMSQIELAVEFSSVLA